MLNLSARPSQGSCFKLLYKRSKLSALFAEERKEKLQSKLPENQAKSVSVEKQSPEVFYKKSWSYKFLHIYRKTYALAFRPATLLEKDSNAGVFLRMLVFFHGRGLQLYQKETPTQVFSCEYCNLFKNTCLEELLQAPVFAC